MKCGVWTIPKSGICARNCDNPHHFVLLDHDTSIHMPAMPAYMNRIVTLSAHKVRVMTEICRAFRLGRCRFGDACQYEHSEGEPIPPPPRGECFSFNDSGECKYGSRCRFTHGHDDARFDADGTNAAHDLLSACVLVVFRTPTSPAGLTARV